MAQGHIPGKEYGIAQWNLQQLRSWLQQNLSQLLPTSLQTQDAQLDTVTVNTAVSLSTAAVQSLQSQLGISGGTGTAQWYSGTTAPSAGLGANGDFYLNTTTQDISMRVSGAWSIITNIRGATGTAGGTGATGATGAAGTPADLALVIALGDAGARGPTGSQGPAGASADLSLIVALGD